MSISLTDLVDSVAGERIAELEEQVERLEARLKPLLKFEHAKLVSVRN